MGDTNVKSLGSEDDLAYDRLNDMLCTVCVLNLLRNDLPV